MRRCGTVSAQLVALLAVAGCGVSEADFVGDAEFEACLANVPICQVTAGCTLGESQYIEGTFPGFRSFIVATPADATIVVKLFFKTRRHPGEETEIIWYEPGCADSYAYESAGADIFDKAGGDRVFTQEKRVRRSGDHLVEIFSDAYTHYFARVEVRTPM